jgi:uncharacterized integral membrane protein
MMERIKLIGTVIVIVLVVIIVMVNWKPQDFNLLVTTINMPLAVMLFGTLAIGYLSGMIVGNPLRFLRKKSS